MDKRQGGNRAVRVDDGVDVNRTVEDQEIEAGRVSGFRRASGPGEEQGAPGEPGRGEGSRDSHVAARHPLEVPPPPEPAHIDVPAQTYGDAENSLGAEVRRSIRESHVTLTPGARGEGHVLSASDEAASSAVVALHGPDGAMAPLRESDLPTSPVPFTSLSAQYEEQVLAEEWWQFGERLSTRYSAHPTAPAAKWSGAPSVPAIEGVAGEVMALQASDLLEPGETKEATVREVALVPLLVAIGFEKRTVTLNVMGRQGRRTVRVVQGNVVLGGRPEEEEDLLRFFCETTDEADLELDDVRSQVRHQARPLPWALVDAGLSDESILPGQVRQFVGERLLDGFSWLDASFLVYEHETALPPSNAYKLPLLSLVWPALTFRLGPPEALEWYFYRSCFHVRRSEVPEFEISELDLPFLAERLLRYLPGEAILLDRLVNLFGRTNRGARHEAILTYFMATQLGWAELVTTD